VRADRPTRPRRGDLIQQSGQRGGQPRTLGSARRHQCCQRVREARGHRAGIDHRLLLLCRPQHTRQGEQRLGTWHRAAGDARVQIERQCQRLLQGRGIGDQARFALAPHREIGGDVAALQHFAGGLAHRGLQRVPAGRQAQPQVEAAAVDTAHFPRPGKAGGASFRAGKSSHRGECVGHTAGLLSAGPAHGYPMAMHGSRGRPRVALHRQVPQDRRTLVTARTNRNGEHECQQR
jgi:ribosome modulation factor